MGFLFHLMHTNTLEISHMAGNPDQVSTSPWDWLKTSQKVPNLKHQGVVDKHGSSIDGLYGGFRVRKNLKVITPGLVAHLQSFDDS